ncbi:hypothetical protein [Flagellimonas meridianipacifica]|uniref:Uncharacterized protein n=1 Tax=Flagellimonas meridianipacifica TaxID=1080225 RepID=A0A2T0MEN0_9FLAO|nr:hypothetical protein [Allomuricauda pacifica]PRX56030.1 hypothetical protein CLV81_0018 [Allomuricauda pacifica]
MTYKTKSLLYFFSFVVAATAYYLVEQHQEFTNQMQSTEMAETHFEDSSELIENPQSSPEEAR